MSVATRNHDAHTILVLTDLRAACVSCTCRILVVDWLDDLFPTKQRFRTVKIDKKTVKLQIVSGFLISYVCCVGACVLKIDFVELQISIVRGDGRRFVACKCLVLRSRSCMDVVVPHPPPILLWKQHVDDKDDDDHDGDNDASTQAFREATHRRMCALKPCAHGP